MAQHCKWGSRTPSVVSRARFLPVKGVLAGAGGAGGGPSPTAGLAGSDSVRACIHKARLAARLLWCKQASHPACLPPATPSQMNIGFAAQA